MTIKVLLSKEVFRRFTVFDILRRRKMWRSPVLFALILGVFAGICFLMHRADGAVMLGTVLLMVGLGMPCVYFLSFFLSLNRQITENGLHRPKEVYTLRLTDKNQGIDVENDREHARYSWGDVHHVYRDAAATYLYITADRAFILPHSCIEGSPDELWALIAQMVPKERTTIL